MYAAVLKLREALGGSITVESMIATDEEVIHEAIKSVGYHNKKPGSIHFFSLLYIEIFRLCLVATSKRQPSSCGTTLAQTCPKQWTNFAHFLALALKWPFLLSKWHGICEYLQQN